MAAGTKSPPLVQCASLAVCAEQPIVPLRAVEATFCWSLKLPPEALARPAGVLIVLAQGALLLVLRHALATCREHEAKLAALPPAQEAR